MAFLAVLLLGSAAGAATPPYTNTTVVNGNLSPALNGVVLLKALANAVPPALIKVEPGFYDLGGQQLVMRSLVDIEGSGRDITIIESTASLQTSSAVASVPPGVTAELRELTLRSTSPADGNGIIIQSSRFLMTEVNVESGAAGPFVGVSVFDSSPRINEVLVRAVSGSGDATGFRFSGGGAVVTDSLAFVGSPGAVNLGFHVIGASDVVLDSVVAIVSGGSASNIAVRVREEAKAQLTNVRGTASGGDVSAGLFSVIDSTEQSEVDVKESTFRATGEFAASLFIAGGVRARITESTFDGSNFAALVSDSAILEANQSNFISDAFAVRRVDEGLASFGSSQLVGAVSNLPPGSLRCVFSYDGSYNPRSATCS
ncbi:MAG: hypothetical protein AAGF23_20240 [Acidobacteriota bacterium]